MRIGPWVFAAGLGLLCAGVVSSRADAWVVHAAALTIPLALNGVDTIDIRDGAIDKVVISDKGPPQVHYPEVGESMRMSEDKALEPPACHVAGSTLHCVAGTPYMPGNPTMHLPPGRYRLLAGGAEIRSQVDLEAITLELDRGYVHWTGPVGDLTVKLSSRESTGDAADCDQPKFGFKGGRVGSLRILADTGGVSLEDLSRVANIEVQATGKVGLTVAKAIDVSRIHLSAMSAGAGTVNAKDDDALGACARAMNAAALAEMD